MTRLQQHLFFGFAAVVGILVAVASTSYLTSAATKHEQIIASLSPAPSTTTPAPKTTEQQQAIDASAIAPAAGTSSTSQKAE